ncbi:hypothetical protein NLX83_05955 [Allokutzneria sp. A3M-2-11 16]|uniref:hypothetical protein n=1 Tax=Allokutzneria sp. A3M-2-11 16 TaxID=2962043 RepID=UPI0020B74CCD|nr:hypothetical protein [Allokutzneria sp. A3M-2-11 16]MCP3798795.1 hypothetical protein [Allokutzneria sp. A3M-2-11 16]
MDSGQGPAERYRPHRGRHRQDANALAWTPSPDTGFASDAPGAPAADPLDDTNTGGLRKLDLGLVPASVTPPATWKRAAWFAGLSSAIVLVVLVTAAVTLVGPKNIFDRINALPAYPSELMLVTTTTPAPTRSEQGARSAARPSGAQGGAGQDGTGGGPRRTTGAPTGTSSPSGTTPTTTSSMTTPPVTTVPSLGPELIPVRQLTESTVQFFSAVTNDIEKAFTHLTGPELKKEGLPSFEKRFGSMADRVEFKGMRVDPVRGVTTSVIEIRDSDGRIVVEERELRFVPNAAPLVDAERLVSTAQR